jgi:hypothetical protein
MTPTATNKCKRQIAEATGLMSAGTCATTAIRWSFRQGSDARRTADPRVNVPLEQVKAWIKLWKSSDANFRRKTKKVWPTIYRRLATSDKRWALVTGPASATIATLLDLNWRPATPHNWATPDRTMIDFTEQEGVTHHSVVHLIRIQLEHELWQHAAKAWNAQGLEHGTPSITPASIAYRKLIRQGRIKQATALEHVVCNKTWCGERLLTEGVTSDPDRISCSRCGHHLETPLHRYYQCPDNKHIDDDDITSTKHFGILAAECPEQACLWFRAILPRSLMGKSAG